MKKIVFAALMLASVAGFAQEKKEKPEGGRPPKEERLSPEERTKQLSKDLKLDAAQQEKVKAVFAEQDKKHEGQKPEAGKRPEKGEKPKGDDPRKKEHEEVAAKMKQILNKDQYEKWQKAEKKGKPGKPEKKEGGKPKEE